MTRSRDNTQAEIGGAWRLVRPPEGAGRLSSAGRRLARRSRREPAPVLTLPVALIAAAALACVLGLLAFDEEISRAMAGEPGGVRIFLTYATDAGLIRWYLYPAAALCLGLLLVEAREATRRRRLRLHALAIHGAYFAAGLSAAAVVTNVLKVLFGRARPVLLDEQGGLAFSMIRFGHDYASFPSGHSTTMGVVTAAAMVWFPMLRWPLLAVGACLAMSRIVVEAHFPSDVAAGFAIGFLVALVLARWLALRRIVYRLRRAGQGWRGLVPVRPAALGA